MKLSDKLFHRQTAAVRTLRPEVYDYLDPLHIVDPPDIHYLGTLGAVHTTSRFRTTNYILYEGLITLKTEGLTSY
jgi:hypothetical protein